MPFLTRLKTMLAGGDSLRIGPLGLSLSRFGVYLVLRSGPRPAGLVIKPMRYIRLAEDTGRYRYSGQVGLLY